MKRQLLGAVCALTAAVSLSACNEGDAKADSSTPSGSHTSNSASTTAAANGVGKVPAAVSKKMMPGSSYCGTASGYYVVAVNGHTTCDFAKAVINTYVTQDAPAEFTVMSKAAGRNITMHCSGQGGILGCAGGEKAEVTGLLIG